MPRDIIYRATMRGPRGVVRWLDIYPASASAMPDDAPIEEIPDGAIELLSPGAESFADALAIGLQRTGSQPVMIRFGLLGGSDALRDLRQYLLDFDGIDGTLFLSSGNRPFKLSNTFRLYSNRGWGGPPEYLEFEGVQRRNPGAKGSVVPGVGFECEYVLYDTFRATMETITMQDLARQTLDTSDAAPFLAWYDKVFERIYRAEGSSRRYGWWWAGYYSQYHRMHTLFYVLQCLAHDVYCQFIRVTAARNLGDWRFVFRSTLEDATDYTGMPWDLWKVFQQPEDNHQYAGAQVDREELAIMGGIRISMDADPVGGLLYPGSDSLYAFETAYKFLDSMCEACWCLGKIMRASGRLQLWFRAPMQGLPTQLTFDDFRSTSDGQPRIPVTLGGKVVQAVKVELRGAQGKDLRSRQWPESASSRDQAYTVRCLWDNLPTIGERDWWLHPPTAIALPGAESQGVQGFYTMRMYPWKLFAFAHPFGSSGAWPVMVSPYCELWLGDGWSTTVSIAYQYPEPAADNTDNFREPMRTLLAAVQANDGIPLALSGAVRQTLGADGQLFVDTVHDVEAMSRDQVGLPFQMPLGVDDATTASGLLGTDDTYLDNYPGRVVLTDMTPDYAAGTAKCTFHGIR